MCVALHCAAFCRVCMPRRCAEPFNAPRRLPRLTSLGDQWAAICPVVRPGRSLLPPPPLVVTCLPPGANLVKSPKERQNAKSWHITNEAERYGPSDICNIALSLCLSVARRHGGQLQSRSHVVEGQNLLIWQNSLIWGHCLEVDAIFSVPGNTWGRVVRLYSATLCGRCPGAFREKTAKEGRSGVSVLCHKCHCATGNSGDVGWGGCGDTRALEDWTVRVRLPDACPAPGIQVNAPAIHHNAFPPNITPSSGPGTQSTSTLYDCWQSNDFPFFCPTNGTITCTLPL